MIFRLPPNLGAPQPADAARVLEATTPQQEIFAPHSDVTITEEWNPDAVAQITDIVLPMYGVGFTGALPPNARLVLVPYEYRSTLEALLRGDFSAGTPTGGRAYWPNIEGRRITPGGGALGKYDTPYPILTLYPGEVLPFTKRLSKGLSVFAATPWVSVDLNHSARTLANDSGHYCVQPRAVARVYSEPRIPDRIPYGKAPARMFWSSDETVDPVQDDESEGFACGGDVTHVTVHLCDNAGWGDNRARIQGAETGNYEVWWLCGGIWCHNPADDFDAAGRGAADASHDVEVYEVPHNADKIFIKHVSGSTFYVDLIMSSTRG